MSQKRLRACLRVTFIRILEIVSVFQITASKTDQDLEKVHCLHQFQPKPRALRVGKWAVPTEKYDQPIYPASCTGPAILMSNRAVKILGKNASGNRYQLSFFCIRKGREITTSPYIQSFFALSCSIV